MEKTLTIEQFNDLLHSEKPSNPLLAALFSLTDIENPEELVKAAAAEAAGWAYWF